MRDLLSVDKSRVKNLLRMDLHRMIHGKAFWVMSCIAVFIPVMMLTQMGEARELVSFIGSTGAESSSGFGAGTSISILTVLTGMLLSIYIGKEYTSGYIKNIITAHANKCDYILAKTIVATLWNVVFMLIYVVTLLVLGMVMGLPSGITSVLGLVMFLIEKLLLSIPMSILMIAINLVFRRNFGWSIMFVCIAGTGFIVMTLQMGLQMLGLGSISSILNFTISGAATFATLNPNLLYMLLIAGVSVLWTFLCTLAADALMNSRDVL